MSCFYIMMACCYRCNIVYELIPLLNHIGCILSQMTVGTNTESFMQEVPGAEYAMHQFRNP